MANRERSGPAQQGDRDRNMNEMDDESTIGGTEDIRGIGDEDEEDLDEDDTEDLEEDEEEGIR